MLDLSTTNVSGRSDSIRKGNHSQLERQPFFFFLKSEANLFFSPTPPFSFIFLCVLFSNYVGGSLWWYQVLLFLKMCILGFQAVEVSGYHCFLLIPFSCFLLVIFTGSLVFYAVSGGSMSLVQGSYEYYHYLQDGFNDSVM